jgi:uncharacterized membrane protein YgcG
MRTSPVLALLLLSSLAASAKFYEAERYDVKLQLDSRGELAVTETIDARFIAGPFHFFFRELATTETDGISDVRAAIDGTPCPPGTGPGEVEITGTSPVMVRWYFDSIMSGAHTFTVQYRVLGAIRPNPDSQSLVWRILPSKRGYTIRSSAFALEYPAAVAPASVALSNPAQSFDLSQGRADLQVTGMESDAEPVLRAQFPANSFAAPPPQWLIAKARSAANSHIGTLAGASLGILFLALAFRWMFRIRAAARPANNSLDVPARLASPPDSWPPAVAGHLLRKQSLRLGTLLDLARRRVLRIEELPKSRFMGRQFQILWIDQAAALAPHERALLQIVFPHGESAIPIKEFFTRGQTNSTFTAAIRAELEAAGFVDPSRVQARRTLLTAGAICIIAGPLLFGLGVVVAEPFIGSAVMLPGAAAVAAAILALILGATQLTWTDAGMLVAARWHAFARHLSDIASSRAEPPSPSDLERFLPYAAAFGSMVPLMKRLQKLGALELPAWFQAIQSADGADIDAFYAFTIACDTASTAASGDGGSSGGDGGASGGGSSGAG